MKRVNAIPVALLEYVARTTPAGEMHTVFAYILRWFDSPSYRDAMEAAVEAGDLPADWYASSGDWTDPAPLDAAPDPDPRAETVRDAAREDLAALNDGLQALGALAAMILRISERLEGATT